MLISKRSPANREAFTSRFRKGSDSFPLRQFLACREEMASVVVHMILLAAFLGALVYFALTLHRVFTAHGRELNPWYERLALLMLGGMMLLCVRRILSRIGVVKELRSDIAHFKSQLDSAEE